MEYILTLKHVNFGKQIDFNRLAAQDIIMQWVYCNVYTAADVRTVMRSIEGLFIEYRKLGKFSTKSPGYWKQFDSFVPSMKDLFDVVADSSRQKTQKKLWGPEFDEEFYKKQKANPPEGYSSTAVDLHRQIQEEPRQKRLNRSRSEHYVFPARRS